MKTKLDVLKDTIDYFINQCEAEMVEISWEIREETNFEVNAIDSLSDYYDEWQNRLNNLEEIKKMLTLEKLAQLPSSTNDFTL